MEVRLVPLNSFHRPMRRDQALANGIVDVVNRDFVTDGRSGIHGIECAQFASATRRRVQALFATIRRGVTRENPERFVKLRGYMIYMWFPEPGGLGLPPKRSDGRFVAEILDALAEYKPDPTAVVIPPGPLPDQAPDIRAATTESGCRFYAVPIPGPVNTGFFADSGFELGVAYTTSHRQAEIGSEVTRLIKTHDKPGVDDLVITVGGPDRNGLAFQSEESLIGLWLDSKPSVEPTECISRTFLHVWSTGAVLQLAPEFGAIARRA